MPTLSPREAAERSGFSRQTIANAIHARELHASQNNLGHWRISDEDLAVWLEDRGPKQNVKDGEEEPDKAAEGVSHNGGANGTHNAQDMIHTLTHTLQSQAEEIGRLTALLDTRDNAEIARLTAEGSAKDARIEDLVDQIERLEGAHQGRLDDLRSQLDREREDRSAERERMLEDHRSIVSDLRAELSEERRSIWDRLFGR